jgi:hypothetical protein
VATRKLFETDRANSAARTFRKGSASRCSETDHSDIAMHEPNNYWFVVARQSTSIELPIEFF